MTKCRKCGRELKTEPGRSNGIGPVCARKNLIESIRKDQGDTDEIVPYDGGALWIERLTAQTLTPRGGNSYSIQPATHPASGIRTNVPRMEYLHSPTGYNFGYGGSGPADFALNCCLLLCKSKKDAHTIHQKFKMAFVALEQGDRLEIPRENAIQFIKSLGVETRDPKPPTLF